MILTHKFVKSVPEILEDGVLYVSMEYATVIHKCCCGCGGEVVTPLSPTDWELTFDGKTISLSPSIGNWSFKCQSHYWVRNNLVEWAPKWSKKKIAYCCKLDEEERQQAPRARNKTKKSFLKKLLGGTKE